MKRISANKYGNDIYKYRSPFWLPASNYYILAIAVAVVSFFVIWGILHEGGEDTPWLSAGLCACFLLGGAVFLREIVLRKARNNYLSAQRKLDYNIKGIPRHIINKRAGNKLSLQKNAELIKGIQKKSDAAKVLGKLSDGHLEVFEICNEYLLVNDIELKRAGIGSPRIAALRRGRELVKDLHRFHLLTWAEIECRSLTREAKNKVSINEKLEKTQDALDVLEAARQFYPNERDLIESEIALLEFFASTKVSNSIEMAERSAFKGNYKRAISHYKDALYFMARENPRIENTDLIAQKINIEIAKLQGIAEADGTKLKKGERTKGK